MMTTCATAAAPAYGPGATAPERSASYASASVDASARALLREQRAAGVANEARVQDVRAQAAAHKLQEVPDVMNGLSTVAMAGAMSSMPAAINMMREIALASASGSLSDADRQALQDDYAQLTQQVVTSVGSVSAGERAQARHREAEEDAANLYRQTSDDQRSALTQTRVEPGESTQQQTVTQNVTTQRSVLVADGRGAGRDPQQTFRTETIHVGTDSYEPVATRQRLSTPTQPETLGHFENHAETHSVSVVQAAQVTRFVEVAQAAQVPPLTAVA